LGRERRGKEEDRSRGKKVRKKGRDERRKGKGGEGRQGPSQLKFLAMPLRKRNYFISLAT